MAILLPSLDEQLRSAREAAGEAFIWAHIDTCLSGYLRDHHNRDGELLLGAIVFGNTSIGCVLDELESEYQNVGWSMGENRRGFDYEAGKAALARLREENADRLDMPFDSSLEVLIDDDGDDCDDYCQAWFLLSWDVPEENE